MRLQVINDLHLELNDLVSYEVEDQAADVVVLAGDVKRGGEGVSWAAEMWPDRPVIFVMGNHEPYGSQIETALADCRARATGTRVHILENDKAVLDGVRFLGATLWTDFALFGEGDCVKMAREVARETMADYRAIARRDGKPLRPEDTQELHGTTIDWLSKELAREHDGPTVVVTHHAPHLASIGLQAANRVTPATLEYIHAAYASDLSWLIEHHQPALWIHGHTHESGSYQIGSTRVVSNQHGYFLERSGWDRRFTVEI